MSRALFDSNILIDFLAGVPQAAEEVALYEDVSISVISWIEVMAGVPAVRALSIETTLSSFACIGVDEFVAARAAGTAASSFPMPSFRRPPRSTDCCS